MKAEVFEAWALIYPDGRTVVRSWHDMAEAWAMVHVDAPGDIADAEAAGFRVARCWVIIQPENEEA